MRAMKRVVFVQVVAHYITISTTEYDSRYTVSMCYTARTCEPPLTRTIIPMRMTTDPMTFPGTEVGMISP